MKIEITSEEAKMMYKLTATYIDEAVKLLNNLGVPLTPEQCIQIAASGALANSICDKINAALLGGEKTIDEAMASIFDSKKD